MNLKSEILNADSKEDIVFIANKVKDDKEMFAELMALFFSKEARTTYRYAWVVSHCVDMKPSLVTPYLSKMVKNLYKDVGDATKRSSVRILQTIEIPKKLWGETIEICFRFLMSKEATVIKIFSMTVLYNLSLKIPEISNELKVLIEDQLPYGTAGFKNRGKKILAKLEA